MKFFIAITLIAAVATAAVVRPLRSEIAEIQEIIAAIQSPSTNPATAAALEQMLLDILGAKPVAIGPAIVNPVEGISVGPAIINPVEGIAIGPTIVNPVEGISVGPAIIPFPVPEAALAEEETAIVPNPVTIADGVSTEVASGTSLVQIVLNINQAAESSPISVGPANMPEIQPEPVHIVDSAAEPVQVIEVAPEPVQVIEVAPVPSPISPPIAVNPVGVIPAEPVHVGVPNIPEAQEIAEIQEIIAAIQSPSTDPATAAALEDMLLEALGLKPEPIAVGPAIVNPVEGISVGPAIINPVEGIAIGPTIVNPVEGISVGPAIIPFPMPEGALAEEETAIVPTPVTVVDGVSTDFASETPLVQIILNINQAAESSPISVGPAVVPEIQPEPVHVVDSAADPVQVVELAPEPVQVVEVAPVPAEPVQIGVPVIPEAAVVLPEELN